METEVLHRSGLGSSLPVENVQALASRGLEEVPPRYLRPASELGNICETESLAIPVIDMIKLGEDHLDHSDEIEKFHSACKEWGFLQVHHLECFPTPSKATAKLSLCRKTRSLTGATCSSFSDNLLPRETSGFGQRTLPLSEDLIAAQHLRATMDSYSSELVRIFLFLLRAMAKNLRLSPDALLSMFEEGTQAIRLNYYPPCKRANEVMGLTPHSDATGLTLLNQVNDVDGLQIKKDGKWLPIKPVPGAFIVNVGDVIEIMSNGEYKSIEHRAMVNPGKERLSIAAFHGPHMQAAIGPLPDLAGKSGVLSSRRTAKKTVKEKNRQRRLQ